MHWLPPIGLLSRQRHTDNRVHSARAEEWQQRLLLHVVLVWSPECFKILAFIAYKSTNVGVCAIAFSMYSRAGSNLPWWSKCCASSVISQTKHKISKTSKRKNKQQLTKKKVPPGPEIGMWQADWWESGRLCFQEECFCLLATSRIPTSRTDHSRARDVECGLSIQRGLCMR